MFDQKTYTKSWDKENIKKITLSYRKDFVERFNESCKELGLVRSQVFKKAMEDTIKKAEETK